MDASRKKLNLTKFYDDLAQSWDNTRPKYTLEIFKKIVSRLDKNEAHSILDFGCGTGLFCKYLSENLPKAKIKGVDISKQMIERAKKNCPGGNFYVGDILSFNLSNFDIIVSKDVFNHVYKIPTIISRLNQLLNKNGMLIIANREREQATRMEILSALQSLKHQVSEEQHSFTPTEDEINVFLKTLTGFSSRHKQAIRKKLLTSGGYYIIYARKK